MATLVSYSYSPPTQFDMEAFRQGDEQTFRRLYEHFSGALSSFIRQFNLPTEETQDIINIVLARLYRRRADMNSYTHICKLLFTMAKNESINYHRRKARMEKKVDALTDLYGHFDDPHQQHQAIEAAELKKIRLQTLWQEIALLPLQQQKILALYYKADLATADIATLLKLSPQTVRNHKANAMKAIKRTFCP